MHVDGGEVVSLNYDLERIPVFVRAGVALPIGPVVQSATARRSDAGRRGRGFGHAAKLATPSAPVATWNKRDGQYWRSYGQRVGRVRRFAEDRLRSYNGWRLDQASRQTLR